MAAALAAQRALTGPRTLTSVFFGGGTPSLMDPDWAGELLATARALWTPAPDLEVSLEANPTDAETARFAAFRTAGVERLSLGLQALDDDELRFLGRLHDAAAGRRAAERAAAVFPRVSLDLIYALPGQTAARWREALGKALALGAEHLSPYQLTVEPFTAFDRAVRRGALSPAEPDLAADLFEATQEALERAGFDAYEVSNHARGRAARSRHNLAYWRGSDYVGAGPGAHGRLTLGGVRVATEAHASPAAYVAAVRAGGPGWAEQAALTPVEAAQERVLMGLRTSEGVGWTELAALQLTPAAPRVAALAEAGLVEAGPERLVATGGGRRVLDRLAAVLATPVAG